MRTIKERTLAELCKKSKYKPAKSSLEAWVSEVKHSDWQNGASLKRQYASAGILDSKRVVFNIKGNAYRLVVDVEYRIKLVFIVWFGTHKEYDQIDAKTINYGD